MPQILLAAMFLLLPLAAVAAEPAGIRLEKGDRVVVIGNTLAERMRVMPDKWTVSAMDGSRGAHWEHTFALLPDGNIFVLTALDGGKSELSRLGVTVSSLLA